MLLPLPQNLAICVFLTGDSDRDRPGKETYPDEQLVLITTGSQGESMAALSRMAANIHKKITIKPNDAIIFSSHPIQVMRRLYPRLSNELSKKGARLFSGRTCIGHACRVRRL